MPAYFIENPTANDILCGKDKTYAKHPGNQAYRAMIQQRAPSYSHEPSKQVKMSVTKEIVEILQAQGARFLRKRGMGWEEISNQQARDKTSHALRFCAASKKHQKRRPVATSCVPRHHRRTVSSDTAVIIPESAVSLYRRQQEILESTDFGFVHRVPEEPVPEVTVSNCRMSSRELDAILQEPLNEWDGLLFSASS